MDPNNVALIALAATVLFPILWFVSEIRGWSRELRIALGSTGIFIAIAVVFVTASFASCIQRINDNANYGFAMLRVFEAVTANLDQGKVEETNAELKRFVHDFHPTWYTDANYDGLAKRTTEALKGEPSIKENKKDVPTATSSNPPGSPG